MKGIVIWAHSKCRSTFGLYRVIRDVAGVPVRIVSREGIRANRLSQGQCEADFSELDCPVIGENWEAAERVLAETSGYLHLVAAYQVSPTFRQVILAAKKRGDPVGVISEVPWNSKCGLARVLWPLYLRTLLRWRVRAAVSAADFLVNYSGDKIETALALGWTKEKIIPFGYFPPPLAAREGASNTRSGGRFKLLATATKGRWDRGEKTIRKAVESLGDDVELILPGFVGMDEVIRLYRECDAVVAAGLDEPWGIRVNDAVNFGKPVLVSDGMGARKMVEETGAGLVFKAGSAADLAAKVRELIANYEKYAVAAQAAVEKISPETKARELVRVVVGSGSGTNDKMRIVHFCAGLEKWNGMANTARQFVAEETAAGHDSRITSDLNEITAGVDVVHLHGAWLPVLWSAAKRAKKIGAKLIIRPAGSYDPVRLAYHGWKKRLVAPFEHRMLRRADVVQATCQAEAEWIRAYARGIRVEITDLKRFFDLNGRGRCGGLGTSRPTESTRPIHLLYLGRRHPLKGVEYLERAVAGMRDEGRGKRIELRIVSNATGEELEKVWAWCDVLVLPTLSENFGRVVAEALERGRKVVTTDGAPVWEGQPGVVYLKGFREGTDEERVELLKRGLRFDSILGGKCHSL